MPRIKANKYIYITRDGNKDLKVECYRYGVKTKEIADALNCSVQNVRNHFKDGSFSMGQYLIIKKLCEEHKQAEENMKPE